MDFYSHQAGARRQSRALVWAFLIAVAAVVLALDLVLFTVLGSAEAQRPALAPIDYAIWHPGTAIVCTLLILAVICFSSLFKSLQLRSGGGVVARSLGGVRVEQDTRDPKRRRLRNVVEEMAIASGVPVPEIYVLEHESAINAFAAGHSPANAAVSVTQGALDNLNRDQLQGVIAHEFSHVVNGDMRLNVQLMGWLFGLFVVALIGRTFLRFAPRGGKKGGGALLLAALAVMTLGYVGLLAGRILQAAVSRQREKLADASAVQFTRDPGGLKNALLKIAGLGDGSHLNAPGAEQAAHMLFAPGIKRLFATHPPLAERIRLLDPSFDVRSLSRLAAQAMNEPPDLDASFQSEAAVSQLQPAAPAGASVSADSTGIAAQVGQLDTVHIAHAHELRLALPATLRELAASADHARAMVLALLLSRDADVRNRQLARLANALDPAALAIVDQCAPLMQQLAPMLRLPALLQVFPDLRRLPLRDRVMLCALADDLINADSRIEVFEFCLGRLLEMLLKDELEARAPHGRLTLRDTQRELQLLFSTLAHAGATDEGQARLAYDAGMQAAQLATRAEYAFDEAWPRRLGAALVRLDTLQALEKKTVVEGLVRTVAHDSMLNVAEAELLRTVCAIIHCPMPPLLPAVT